MKPSPFDKLDKLLKRTVEPKGPEWFTAKEYSAHGGYSESSVRLLLSNLVKEGKIEMLTDGKEERQFLHAEDC